MFPKRPKFPPLDAISELLIAPEFIAMKEAMRRKAVGLLCVEVAAFDEAANDARLDAERPRDLSDREAVRRLHELRLSPS